MTGRNTGGEGQARRLAFGRFMLDLDRGCLLANGAEVPLRPKTFAVLKVLVGNAGRLISKDELIAAVWQNGAVTDDALVQSVGELRRALGDEKSEMIRTVPRRGYRFDAEVSAETDASGRTAGDLGAAAPTMPPMAAAPGGLPVDASMTAASPAGSSDIPPPRPTSRSLAPLYAAMAVALLIAAAWAVWSGFRADLTRSSTPSANAIQPAKPAIAVLPFRNNSGDPAREYFVDGLTQDVISALGRFSSLTVMSWNAVLPYRDAPVNPGQVAQALDVRYQIEGSVQQTGDRVRVNAQLIDADGRILWTSQFDEALGDLFKLQDSLAAQIVAALATRVTQFEQRRVSSKPPGSLEAYDYVLRARPALRRPTRANNAEARAMLRRATELDPNYAAAYAALAETYHIAVSMGWAESPTTFLARAEELANKALDLDDSDVRARVMLGRIHLFYNRYDDARAQMERALAINPNDADGLAGRGHILLWLGQTDAAVATLETAQRVDPDLNVLDRFALALAYYLKGRYDDCIAQAELNLRKTEDTPFNQILLAAAYAQEKRREDAARLATAIRRSDPTFDPDTFGNKFLNPADRERLRDGFRKANLYTSSAPPDSAIPTP
jgi:adenylate cyclase